MERLDSIHVHLVEFGFGPASGRLGRTFPAIERKELRPPQIVTVADRQSHIFKKDVFDELAEFRAEADGRTASDAQCGR